MKKKINSLLFLLAILLYPLTGMSSSSNKKDIDNNLDATTSTPTSASQSQSDEGIIWHVLSSGGTDGTSYSFNVLGTVGQTASGVGTSNSFRLNNGYWQDFSSVGGCCGIFTGGYTGNTDCSTDGKRNLGDITRLIDKVYVSKTDLCCAENGDIDGDVDGKINLGDITRLIDHVYVSKDETVAC